MRFVITAGPTREYLDPVRFLSNPSTGRMGFSIAAMAARRKHQVVLIAGPSVLPTPKGVERRDVVSAREMLASARVALEEALATGDKVAFVSVAAVADWRPASMAARKLKKDQMTGVLRLVRNPDILRTLHRRFSKSSGGRLKLVGFAAETNDVLKEAARKCREKGLEFIVANDVGRAGSGFGTRTNQVTFVFPDGACETLPLLSKMKVADLIILRIEDIR